MSGNRPPGQLGSLLRGAEMALSASLLGSFLLPWISSLGAPVMAYEIRDRLRGPHRLASAFTRDAQVSLDYTLSLGLWAVPAAASLALLLSLPARGGRLRAATLLAAGLAGTAAYAFLKVRLAAYPFQRMEEGALLAVFSGAGLLGLGTVRLAPQLERMKK